MRLFAYLVLDGVFFATAVVVWQHLRYLGARRRLAQDHQPLLHPRDAFHVVTLVKLRDGDDLFDGARRLIGALEKSGETTPIYAGKALILGAESRQVSNDWTFALLCQHPSRDAWNRTRDRPEVVEALASFERVRHQGMRRNPWFNLALPVGLLGRRLIDLATWKPNRFPFEKRNLPATDVRVQRAAALRAETELGQEAVVVVNFLLSGTTDQEKKNSGYGYAMMGLMAERAHGPTHMGKAVSVDGDARFDSVALVYYPGVSYFADMIESAFIGNIIGGKQLGDTIAIVTAPFLDELADRHTRNELPQAQRSAM